MSEIYWITRIGALYNLFLICSILFGVSAIVAGIHYCTVVMDSFGDEEFIKKSKKLLIKSITGFFITMFCLAFTPTKNECLAIFGLGGTIDYIKSNDKAKKLPDKVVDALDKFLEERSKKETKR